MKLCLQFINIYNLYKINVINTGQIEFNQVFTYKINT